MAEFHTKSSERCKRVEDEATTITGMVISIVGSGPDWSVASDAEGDMRRAGRAVHESPVKQ
jgi:hypothetical protein